MVRVAAVVICSKILGAIMAFGMYEMETIFFPVVYFASS